MVKTIKKNKNKIEELLDYIPPKWCPIILEQPKELLKAATELRFRNGRGCTISCGEKNYYIQGIEVDSSDMETMMQRICQGAAYQFETQMEQGYIPLPNGHRAGICGSYMLNEAGRIQINNISSINLRICREIRHGGEKLLPKLLCDDKFCSTLIVSEPCGGKTTLLTDLVRILSEKGYRCAVIDERGEIAASFRGIPQKDLGVLCDVLDGYPKPYGMMIALRTLAPQVLVCDEIGSEDEVEKMLEAMNAGVPFLATAHARDEEELFNRPQIKRLKEAGAISKVVFLKGAKSPGRIRKVITVNEFDDKDFWCCLDC